MSSVVIAGNTSGTITLDAPNVAGTTTLTLPTTSGTIVTTNTMPTGSVLQVVSTTKTDVFSTTSGSFVDITGLSVSITPTSASNKILVLLSFTMAGTGNAFSRLMRGSTAIFIGDARGTRDRVSTGDGYTGGVDNANMSNSITYLDSPATTSATTYKLQLRAETGSFSAIINATRLDPDNFNRPTYASSITVMEIKG